MTDDKRWDVGAAGAVIRDGRVLMVRTTYGENKGRWLLPGGYAHHDECLDQTAVREIQEETGIVTEVEDVIGLRTRHSKRGGAVFVLFRLRYVSGEPVPDEVEVDRVAWFSPADVESMGEEQVAALGRGAALAALSVSPGLPEDKEFPLKDEAYQAFLAGCR